MHKCVMNYTPRFQRQHLLQNVLLPLTIKISQLYREFQTAWKYGGLERMVLCRMLSGMKGNHGDDRKQPPQVVLQQLGTLRRCQESRVAWKYGGLGRMVPYKVLSGMKGNHGDDKKQPPQVVLQQLEELRRCQESQVAWKYG
ncbi:hypothetical protein CN579_24660, partial [Bacillus toyonensis]